MVNIKNRSVLDLLDFTQKEFFYVLDLARDLKRAKYAHNEIPALTGKNVVIIFEKDSTRTRNSFEVACADQGAHCTYIGPTGSHIGKKESVKDTARVLGRMYDGIEYRGFEQKTVEILAEYSGVPVYNGLTDYSHPTQGFADALTVIEHTDKPLKDVVFAYVGDAHMNTGNCNLEMGTLLGLDMRIVAPKSLWPAQEIIEKCQKLAKSTGARITLTDDVAKGVKDADFISGDIWVSMGEAPEVWKQRIQLLKPYQINAQMMAMTGKAHTKFMHCLPAYHNNETVVGAQVEAEYGLKNGIEVTEDVFEGPNCIVFDEAENRMHTIKALLVSTLA